MSEYETCERCGRDVPSGDRTTVDLLNSYEVCYGCAETLTGDVEFYDWQDRYTEEQHERAVEELSNRDEIKCVISDYEQGAIIIHTPYVSSDVVADFCEHFGFQIRGFHPVWEQEDKWPCVSDHGSLFEVSLSYEQNSDSPIPIKFKFETTHIDTLSDSDKQF